MSRYATLDEKIVAAIRKSPCTFKDLENNKPLMAMANELAPADRFSREVNGWRLIDRRLQAMRKAGVIEHREGYWRPVRKRG